MARLTVKALYCTRLVLVLAAALAATAPAHALEANWSGFATIGYARSNSAYTYQRFINEDGSFKRDSVLAGQLDLQLTPQWSATAQVKLSADDRSDSRLRVQPSWAFVAWRPDNDWLLRVGKMRVPLYLNSESLDIGVAHDMARHPYEMYSAAPTNDFAGAFVTRTIALGQHDLTVDAYLGQAAFNVRTWRRDGLPPVAPAGARFVQADIDIGGIVLTARDVNSSWRLGWHQAKTQFPGQPGGIPVRFPRVDIAPGLGYWQVDDALPGPGIARSSRVRNAVLSGGADVQLGGGWRVVGEFMHIRQKDTELGSSSRAGYVAVSKRVGDFAPYAGVSRQLSSQGLRTWYQQLTQPSLPAFIPQAAQVNAAQRVAGESLYAIDQHSVALGTSYALSATAKLKAEWMRTSVGQMSTHFDTPPGQSDARDVRVNTLSLSYSVAF